MSPGESSLSALHPQLSAQSQALTGGPFDTASVTHRRPGVSRTLTHGACQQPWEAGTTYGPPQVTDGETEAQWGYRTSPWGQGGVGLEPHGSHLLRSPCSSLGAGIQPLSKPQKRELNKNLKSPLLYFKAEKWKHSVLQTGWLMWVKKCHTALNLKFTMRTSRRASSPRKCYSSTSQNADTANVFFLQEVLLTEPNTWWPQCVWASCGQKRGPSSGPTQASGLFPRRWSLYVPYWVPGLPGSRKHMWMYPVSAQESIISYSSISDQPRLPEVLWGLSHKDTWADNNEHVPLASSFSRVVTANGSLILLFLTLQNPTICSN